MKNPVGWFEIYVNNIEDAKKFYQTVFQTELTPLSNPGIDATPGLEMWSFSQDFESYGASGAICKMPGISAGGTGSLVYFSCEDCAIEEARVKDAGGTILKPKLPIGEYGFISICKDPDGNWIGLHSMK